MLVNQLVCVSHPLYFFYCYFVTGFSSCVSVCVICCIAPGGGCRRASASPTRFLQVVSIQWESLRRGRSGSAACTVTPRAVRGLE